MSKNVIPKNIDANINRIDYTILITLGTFKFVTGSYIDRHSTLLFLVIWVLITLIKKIIIGYLAIINRENCYYDRTSGKVFIVQEVDDINTLLDEMTEIEFEEMDE